MQINSMRVLILLGLFPFVFSCHSKNNTVFSKNVAIENGWLYSEPITFKIPSVDLDQNHYYDYFLLVRNNKSYPFENLFLISAFKDKNSLIYQDTLEYLMANKDGRLTGSGFGSIKTNKFVLKEKVQTPSRDSFEIEIRHAMRHIDQVSSITSLSGIHSLELRIDQVIE